MNFDSKIEKIIFYNLPTILFCLIPIFLITGPFLSDLSISLIALLFFFHCLKNKNFSYFKNKYFYFFLIFWIYLILNSLINNFNLDSLKISFFYFRYAFFVIAIVALLDVEDKFIKYFFYSIFLCFLVLIFDGFYQYFVGKNILGWETHNRVSSLFGDEKILGSYLARLWPIFFGLYIILFKKKNTLFPLFISTFILSEALIFMSGDRTAFFFINLSAIFVIIFSSGLAKLRLLTLLSSIVLIVIISIINPTAKQRVINQTFDQMNLTDDKKRKEEGLYIFSKEHTHHYITAYRMYMDNLILGVGVKNFRKFCSDEKYIESKLSCASHPHNTYLQLLSETGSIGFTFLIIILIYFFKNIITHLRYRLKRKYFFNDFEICILSGIAIYLWPFIPTGNLFNNWLNILMILNLPLFIWSRKTANT